MDEADEQFHGFVAERGRRMVAFAYLLTRDLAQAEDLVQDSLLKAYLRWRKAGAPDHPEAYVRRTIVHEYVGLGRRRRIEPERIARSEFVAPRMESELAERDALWTVLGELPPRQRAAVVLRYYEDLSDDDIGAALGCARGTVRSLVSRALTVLRDHPSLVADHREAGSTS